MKINSIKKVLYVASKVLIICLSSFYIILVVYSPGKIDPYLDADGEIIPNSISEKTFVQIGGISQGMFIRSKNINNPVLLYLHGGPCFPNYFLIDKFKPGLEDYFTVCYWEQRGGGLSFNSDVTIESMNFNQLASDALKVTNYLCQRFDKSKIYIMAHSGGTPMALLAVSQRPELFYAYVGIGQITNQAESERIAYKYMLDHYSKIGDQKSINAFLKYPIFQSEVNLELYYNSLLRDNSMHELGIGTMHKMKSVFREIFVPVLTCKAYTLKEKINIWKSKFLFIPKTNLIHELLVTNFAFKISKLEVPVYFFSGTYDLTVNINLSKAYLNNLQAPLKGFYTFRNSAHSPIYEETDLFRRIIKEDVLENRISLSDK